jgi:hypothetical protein
MMSSKAANEMVSQRIEILQQMALDRLRAEWRRAFKTTPSPRLSADLMRRAIAYHIQEVALGGLQPMVTRQLSALQRAPASAGMRFTLKPGTTLIRDWRGRTHTVRALEVGFDYEGRHYASLTKIAHEITGAAWSGPRFFGLVAASRARGVTPCQPDA